MSSPKSSKAPNLRRRVRLDVLSYKKKKFKGRSALAELIRLSEMLSFGDSPESGDGRRDDHVVREVG